jgi:ABC-type multidrug transport system fused ATPase/permease subunit
MCVKNILFAGLFVLFLASSLHAQSDFTFSQKEMTDIDILLNKETLLLTSLELHMKTLQQQLRLSKQKLTTLSESSKKSIASLESKLTTASTSLDKLKTINQSLETDYQKQVKKNKILQITLGTVIPITFVCAIGAGLAIGFSCAKYIK